MLMKNNYVKLREMVNVNAIKSKEITNNEQRV